MKKSVIAVFLAAVMILSLCVGAFAATGSYTMTYLPGTNDKVTDMPDNDRGTGGAAYAVSSTVPQREGYEFLYWTLDYGVAYTVTYVVNPDPIYGVPVYGISADTEVIVPTDPNLYDPGDPVTVADQLATVQTIGINVWTGEEKPGTWTFTDWDKEDFRIYEDTTITGAWNFTPDIIKYGVSYVVKPDSIYGVPTDSVTPTDTTEYDPGEMVTVADQLTTTEGYADKGGEKIPGTWMFILWDKEDFRIYEDTTITGAWTFAPDTYSVKYVVNADPTYGKPDDSEVPADTTEYVSGETVDVEDQLTTMQDYALVGGEKIPGTWTFKEWDEEDFRIYEDTTITGEWTFTPDTYSVTYVVNADPTYGTPEDSMAPADTTEYEWKETVDVADQLTTTQDYALVGGEKIPGTWTFKEWDTEDFQITADTTITGAWTFAPDTYRVTYVVNPDPTYGEPEDSMAPADTTEYAWKETVDVADQLTTMQDYALVGGEKIPGTWTFKEWDTVDFQITADTTITGAWTFTPDTYSVTYVVNADSTYGEPEDSEVPEDLHEYAWGELVDVEDQLTTTVDYADKDGEKIPGTWTFTPWDKDDFQIYADTTITGEWTFTPKTYKVTYVVNPDPTYGTPEGSTVPTDPTQYLPGNPVVVKDQLTTEKDYTCNAKGEKISGTWTFTPWDKDDFQIYENTTITGGWTFKPAPAPVKFKYIVHYVLWEDYLKGKITKVADDETREIDKLGITVTEPAKTGNDLKPKYRKNYQPVPGSESVPAEIKKDGQEIWIFYQKKSSSS